jgi:hypothetical protein
MPDGFYAIKGFICFPHALGYLAENRNKTVVGQHRAERRHTWRLFLVQAHLLSPVDLSKHVVPPPPNLEVLDRTLHRLASYSSKNHSGCRTHPRAFADKVHSCREPARKRCEAARLGREARNFGLGAAHFGLEAGMPLDLPLDSKFPWRRVTSRSGCPQESKILAAALIEAIG